MRVKKIRGASSSLKYYRLVHYLHSDKVLEGLHLVLVELPKFKAKNLTEKKMQVLWLRFLTEIGEATKEAEMREKESRMKAAIAERDAAVARADAAVEKLRQTARNLKAMKLTNEQIATATGLSAAEIAAL